MIQATDMTRFYGKFKAVSKVTFSAEKGEVVGLLGQNGAGKTTIMNMLSGCLTPSEGQIIIDGKNLLTQSREAKSSLGYLPEVPPLYPEMTVSEYLRFCCAIKDVIKSDVKKHISELIELAGLSEVKNQLIGSLSKGFRQRVGLAQALCADPKVLLLDEPTAGFDPVQAVAFRKLIRRLSKDRTILFSSHLLSEVQEICDRVLIVHQGQLKMDHRQSQSNDSISYRLVVDGPPSKILCPLRQLSSVRRARLINESEQKRTKMMVEAEAGSDFPSQLLALLSGLNAPILEMTQASDTLESLFLRVTSTSGDN